MSAGRDELARIIASRHTAAAVDDILAAGYWKIKLLSYVVVDRNGKFIKDFGADKVAAREFALTSSKDCMDSGIDWEYRVAAIVEVTA